MPPRHPDRSPPESRAGAPPAAASSSEYAARRVAYRGTPFEEADLAPSPLRQWETWYAEVAPLLPEPNAMVLATADAGGAPSVRTVLLKDVTDAGFAFFTNAGSRKGREVAANPAVAVCLPWFPVGRQVTGRGRAVPLEEEASRVYFASRPWASRIGAWASRQSLPARPGEVQHRWDSLAARWPDTGSPDDVPLPPFWGGLRIELAELEFWQGRPNRLHDRLAYVSLDAAPAPLGDPARWRVERRQP